MSTLLNIIVAAVISVFFPCTTAEEHNNDIGVSTMSCDNTSKDHWEFKK